MEFILDILLLLLLDIVLSVDNAILIASTTKELEGKTKKTAQVIGAAGAVILRLVFIVLIVFTLDTLQNVILVYALGGLVLCYIGISMTIKHEVKESKAANSIFKAVALIMAGDIMMSFDNALIIGEVVIGLNKGPWFSLTIVAIALALSLIIILFCSAQLATFMHNNDWVVYVAAWLLVGLGIEMILKDALFNLEHVIGHGWMMFIAYASSGAIISSKWYFLDRNKSNDITKDDHDVEVLTDQQDSE